ncbi:MAG: hypothetical protein K2P92_01885 [Bdellovibrionaceae bacterium]|nr:hypothetical protein [Pseudobdellovibrionaceae bacterium]
MKKTLLTLICILSLSQHAMAVSPCSDSHAEAEQLLGEDGFPTDVDAFLIASSNALSTCRTLAKNGKWKDLVTVIDKGAKVCQDAQQGNSEVYIGYCYLKVAAVASWVTGD